MGKKRPILDKSIIDNCILRSKFILYAQSALHSKKELQFFLNRLPTASFCSLDSVKELGVELDVLIDGLKRDIAHYLRPIFHEQDINIGDKFWFSSHDLKDGYILLSTKAFEEYDIYDRTLLLSDVLYNDVTYSTGTIVPWILFTKLLPSVKGVIDGDTFTLHYAMRKMKKNGKQV